MCLLDFTLMQKSGPLRMVVKLRCSFICVKQQNIIGLGISAWDAIKLTLKAGFIFSFVVDDPTDLGVAIVVAQVLCLSIFNLSPMQKTCLLTKFYRW